MFASKPKSNIEIKILNNGPYHSGSCIEGVVNLQLEDAFETEKISLFLIRKDSVSITPSGDSLLQTIKLNNQSVSTPAPKIEHIVETVLVEEVLWSLPAIPVQNAAAEAEGAKRLRARPYQFNFELYVPADMQPSFANEDLGIAYYLRCYMRNTAHRSDDAPNATPADELHSVDAAIDVVAFPNVSAKRSPLTFSWQKSDAPTGCMRLCSLCAAEHRLHLDVVLSGGFFYQGEGVTFICDVKNGFPAAAVTQTDAFVRQEIVLRLPSGDVQTIENMLFKSSSMDRIAVDKQLEFVCDFFIASTAFPTIAAAAADSVLIAAVSYAVEVEFHMAAPNGSDASDAAAKTPKFAFEVRKKAPAGTQLSDASK